MPRGPLCRWRVFTPVKGVSASQAEAIQRAPRAVTDQTLAIDERPKSRCGCVAVAENEIGFPRANTPTTEQHSWPALLRSPTSGALLRAPGLFSRFHRPRPALIRSNAATSSSIPSQVL